MKTRSLIFATICLSVLVLFGCEKKEKLRFNPVGQINQLSIKSIIGTDDINEILVLGTSNDKSELYRCTISSGGISSQRTMQSKVVYNDMCMDNGTLWLCGNNTTLRWCADTGKSIELGSGNKFDYSYWNEWQREQSDFIKVVVKNGKPLYLIGDRDFSSGNYYYYNNPQYLLTSAHTEFGVYDMAVLPNDEAYIAGYGTILHISDLGKTEVVENIGGEIFTGICANNNFVFACTYSGEVFAKELPDGKWEKLTGTGKKLLHIATNSYGDLVVSSESKEILLSNNKGGDWKTLKTNDRFQITCLTTIYDKIYMGNERGTITRLSHDDINTNFE